MHKPKLSFFGIMLGCTMLVRMSKAMISNTKGGSNEYDDSSNNIGNIDIFDDKESLINLFEKLEMLIKAQEAYLTKNPLYRIKLKKDENVKTAINNNKPDFQYNTRSNHTQEVPTSYLPALIVCALFFVVVIGALCYFRYKRYHNDTNKIDILTVQASLHWHTINLKQYPEKVVNILLDKIIIDKQLDENELQTIIRLYSYSIQPSDINGLKKDLLAINKYASSPDANFHFSEKYRDNPTKRLEIISDAMKKFFKTDQSIALS